MKSYYKNKQNIALLTKNGKIKKGMDKWEAHEKGLLHRAFTVVLIYKGNYVVQHRKHPVFDDVYDVSSSSHPTFENRKLQNMEQAVIETIKREWNLKEKDLGEVIHKGMVYYEAKDLNSKYSEHELCEIYEVEVNVLPKTNNDYAYDSFTASKKDLLTPEINSKLAPWVKKTIEEDLL